MAEQNYLYAVMSCTDKKWLTQDIWADLTLKKHIPALKKYLAKLPPVDRAAIDRENEIIEKRVRLEDYIKRLSWEQMSIPAMETRIVELKRDVLVIDHDFLVGGGREWPLKRGGEGGSGGREEKM